MIRTWVLCIFSAILANHNLLIDAQSAKLKLCASREKHSINCNYLISENANVECVYAADSVDCLLKINRGEADFGVFTAEEALVALEQKADLQVVASVPHQEKTSQLYDFQTVAVVRQETTDGLSALKGKSYCHFGFNKKQYLTDTVLKAFERSISEISGQTCDKTMTVIENEIRALSTFFSKACRPGTWSASPTWDKNLKKTYSNLCSLCDFPSNCTNKEHHVESTSHPALSCLIDKQGDVAYTTLRSVRQYFQKNSNKTEEYKFLCQDGSSNALGSPNPCSWVSQPWTSVLAASRAGTNVAALLQKTSDSARSLTEWTEYLKRILVENSHEINILSQLQPIETFLTRGLTQTEKRCGEEIRWCTVNAAGKEKCKIVSNVALTHGLSSKITCPVEADSVHTCLKHVNNSDADIVVISTDLGYVARSAYNLTAAMYIHSQETYTGLIVINQNSSIKSIKNLKGKRACFPSFNGLGWLTFLQVQKENSLLPKASCPASPQTLKFFGNSCVPGANDKKTNVANVTIPQSLCAACNSTNLLGTCDAADTNPFYGESGALACLLANAGEVAFLSQSLLLKALATPGNAEANLRVLCKDGSLKALKSDTNVDDCSFSRLIRSEIVTRKDLTNVRSQNIQIALDEINDLLGAQHISPIIKLFGKFNGLSDVLLPSKGLELLMVSEKEGQFEDNYSKLQSSVEHCNDGNMLSTSISALQVLILTIAYRYYINGL